MYKGFSSLLYKSHFLYYSISRKSSLQVFSFSRYKKCWCTNKNNWILRMKHLENIDVDREILGILPLNFATFHFSFSRFLHVYNLCMGFCIFPELCKSFRMLEKFSYFFCIIIGRCTFISIQPFLQYWVKGWMNNF